MSEQTKQILLVDDDADLLSHLVGSLSEYQSLSCSTAGNGREAVTVLEESPIDLVVTDIQMPEMDGFALVSHISRNFPRMPVVIITSHATPAMEHKLTRMGIVSFEKKPIDVDVLANRIFDLLVGVDSGYVQGISIPSFLQILQADRKTCSLKVTNGTKTGYLHLLYGQLVDAEVDDLRGEKAAMAIIGWDGPLTIDIQSVLRLKEKTITADLTHLLMETFRHMDEGANPAMDNLDIADAFDLPERTSIPPAAYSHQKLACVNPGTPFPTPVSEDERELLDCALQGLFGVKGYKASAIMTPDGKVLAGHTKKANTDIHFVSTTINDMFCGLQQKAALLGMGQLEESVFRSKDVIVLVRCMCRKTQPHLHAMAVSSNAESEGLMRIRLKRVAEEATGVSESVDAEQPLSSSPGVKDAE